MKTIDLEMVAVCGVMALAGALGLVVGAVVFLGKSLCECDAAFLAGSYFAAVGIIWVILLLVNYEKLLKNSKYSICH